MSLDEIDFDKMQHEVEEALKKELSDTAEFIRNKAIENTDQFGGKPSGYVPTARPRLLW